jgi:hypothetical protein
MISLFALLGALLIGAESMAASGSNVFLQRQKKGRVALPVMLDSVEVYTALGADSIAVRAEVERVGTILNELRAHAATPEKIRLRERNNFGIILLDSLEVLVVRHENRVDSELSPLANALAIHEQILAVPAVAQEKAAWNEEQLLLRLLLGVIYPFSLLVVLRMTRTGIRRWERDWRSAALQWLSRLAERRGLSEEDMQAKRIINFLTGLERLVLYGMVFILISFTWFALFPQTQPLATSLLARIIGPVLDLIGGTAQGVLLLGYSVLVILLAYWVTHRLSQRRRLDNAPAILIDPVIYFPLRVVIWIVALFLILFPYPGAPRLFAIGVLLIVLLAALIALRPLIEEIAAGIYLNSTYALKTGDRLTIDGAPCVVVAPGLVHLYVIRDQENHWLPYTKILKADVIVQSKTIERA